MVGSGYKSVSSLVAGGSASPLQCSWWDTTPSDMESYTFCGCFGGFGTICSNFIEKIIVSISVFVNVCLCKNFHSFIQQTPIGFELCGSYCTRTRDLRKHETCFLP